MTRRPLQALATPALLAGLMVYLVPGLAANTALAATAPEPKAFPTDWQFDVEVGPLRVVHLPVKGDRARAFYYITYRVINETGQDLFFAPLVELATDRGEVMLAGRGVPLDVTFNIIDRQRNILLEDPIRILGRLQQGEENAKDGIAIWPVGEKNVDRVQIYFMGFSGETKTVDTRDANNGNAKTVTLWKTLMLRHEAPGDLLNDEAFNQGGRILARAQNRWILRKPEAIVTARDREASTAPEQEQGDPAVGLDG